ncbi:MAG: type II toxin-antitoxin system VapB family antitoxin [Sporichthyaceae bacterium]
MPDILIRDVPAEVVASLDAKARQAGLSRSEYLRREIVREAARPVAPCTVEDFKRTAEVFKDLNDPEIMRRAWE